MSRNSHQHKALRAAPLIRAWLMGDHRDGQRLLPCVRYEADAGDVSATGAASVDVILPRGADLLEKADDTRVLAAQLRQMPPPDTRADLLIHWPDVGRYAVTWPVNRGRRMESRVALVTGAAQGFGLGIAEGLATQGARVIVADLQVDAARHAATRINQREGMDVARAIAVDVTVETSVRDLIDQTVAHYGGLDLLVSNAGVLRAGGLDEMGREDFERVTAVNYTGFFLCAKYACQPMKAAAWANPRYSADVVQVNSKSGLQGSNRNFAYAGSKFGGIGLVQSFALELAPDRIKVNAVCPGNYLDGPLWSDPEQGLFVQYLRAGKVPGARTPSDIRAYYEGKVPLGRGCLPADVVKSILYLVEQEYETGQALPVTGGQVMLG